MSTEQTPLRESNIARSATALLCTVASLLIIYLFLQDRSVFLDEANLIRNIFEKRYAELAGGLHYEQSAPFLYSWLVKLSSSFAINSYSYRLPSLVLGLSALWYWRLLALRILTGLSATVVTAMLCTNELVWRYSTECKQYIGDLWSSIILIYLAVTVKPSDKANVVLWIVVGILMQWLSMSSVMLLAGIGLYWLYYVSQGQLKLRYVIVVGLLWLVGCGINYNLILQEGIQSEHMQAYHLPYFLDLTNSDQTISNVLAFVRLLAKKTALGMGTVTVLIVLGVYKGRREGLWLLLTIPILVSLTLSAMHYYSLIERLLLFSMPLLALLVGLGIDTMREVVRVKSIKYFILALIILSLSLAAYHRRGTRMYHQHPTDDLKAPLSEIMQKNAKTPIYISKLAHAAYHYYTVIEPLHEASPSEVVIGTADSNLVKEVEQHMTSDSMWVILSHVEMLEKDAALIREKYNILVELKSEGTICFLIRSRR